MHELQNVSMYINYFTLLNFFSGNVSTCQKKSKANSEKVSILYLSKDDFENGFTESDKK